MSRSSIRDWQDHFMTLAYTIAMRSPDESTKVGCVITSKDNTIISTGYNGLPRGMEIPEGDPRLKRPLKYNYFEHAERNAIYNACRNGLSCLNTILFVPWIPCADCARGIVQAGICQVIYDGFGQTIMEATGRWDPKVSMDILNSCKVDVIPWEGNINVLKATFSGKEYDINDMRSSLD